MAKGEDAENISRAAADVGSQLATWEERIPEEEKLLKLAGEFSSQLVTLSTLGLTGIGFLLSKASEKTTNGEFRLFHPDSISAKWTLGMATLGFAGGLVSTLLEKYLITRALFNMRTLGKLEASQRAKGTPTSLDLLERLVRRKDRSKQIASHMPSVGLLFLILGFACLALTFIIGLASTPQVPPH